MRRHSFLWAAAVILLLAAILPRFCRHASPPRTAPPLPTFPEEIPVAPPEDNPPPEEQPTAPPGPPVQLSPERLRPWIEKLGRARLLHDRRGLQALRKEFPKIYETDISWICNQLYGDLFTAAGAAELVRIYGFPQAVPDLASLITSGSTNPFLKGVAVETLGAVKGDSAAVVLLGALQGDPDAGIRSRAATALARFQTPEAIHGLSAALRDIDPSVRTAAAEALGELGDFDILLAALDNESDLRVQTAILQRVLASPDQSSRRKAMEAHPEAFDRLIEQNRFWDNARYEEYYDPAFFNPGAPEIPWDPAKPRIGITVELGADVSLPEVAAAIFSTAPLDRYRKWFILRLAEEFPAPRAYDTYGIPAGEVPYGELDGSAYLRFRDPSSFKPGILGLAEGNEALVTRVSLLHELGHAFAGLRDEYPRGGIYEGFNLTKSRPPAWQPLVDGGVLPPPVVRDGAFLIPSSNCHMSNHPDDSRFCPVCQLQIHARIAELAGAPLPW